MTNEETPLVEQYNASSEVVINLSDALQKVTVSDIEYRLRVASRNLDSRNDLQSKVNRITDNLTDEYWLNPDTAKDTVIEELCEILGHTPTVTWIVSVEVDGNTYEVETQAEDEDSAIDDVKATLEISVDRVDYTVSFGDESVDVRTDGYNVEIDTDQFESEIEFSATRKFE